MVSSRECYPIHQTLISTKVVEKKNSSPTTVEVPNHVRTDFNGTPSKFVRVKFLFSFERGTRPSSTVLDRRGVNFCRFQLSFYARVPQMSLAMVSYSIVAKVLCCTFVHISVRTGNICIQCTIIILYNRYLVRKIVVSRNMYSISTGNM